MIEVAILWLILCFLSFGSLGLIYVLMGKAAKKPWRLRVDGSYVPKVSILVPTYNESCVIQFKLENLSHLEYPKDLTQIIVVDSKSTDGTTDIVNDFAKQHPKVNIHALIDKEREGKSAALNMALRRCEGNVVIVSDADCFWPRDILRKALPFLADPNVGAISGPKILLNPEQSWVTKSEDAYMNTHNLVKLGESKIGSTVFFEGGFSAYKKDVIETFDPYNTGSDDSGTVIRIIEKNYRAILVPEAKFFSFFPRAWKDKMAIKIRRANQLVRVFSRYASLLLRKRIKNSKRIIVQNIFIYLFAPTIFVMFLATTIFLILIFPYFALAILAVLIPKVRSYLFEVVQNYFLLYLTLFSIAFGKKFVIWAKAEDRTLLKEETLRQHMLI